LRKYTVIQHLWRQTVFRVVNRSEQATDDDWLVVKVDNNSKSEKVGSKGRELLNAEIVKMV
jgi:hypothetical protein